LSFFSAIHTRRLGCSYGSGRSITALTTLKIAVLAPMPRATVSTTAKVNSGDFRSMRAVYRRSFSNMAAAPATS